MPRKVQLDRDRLIEFTFTYKYEKDSLRILT